MSERDFKKINYEVCARCPKMKREWTAGRIPYKYWTDGSFMNAGLSCFRFRCVDNTENVLCVILISASFFYETDVFKKTRKDSKVKMSGASLIRLSGSEFRNLISDSNSSAVYSCEFCPFYMEHEFFNAIKENKDSGV